MSHPVSDTRREPDEDSLAPLLSILQRQPGAPGSWRRCVFSRPASSPWRRMVAEPVSLVRGPAVRVTVEIPGDHRTRTIAWEDWDAGLREILEAAPRHIDLLAYEGDWHARRGKRRWLVSRGRPSAPDLADLPSAVHDRAKDYPLSVADPEVRALFTATGLLGKSGQIRGEMAAKHRQLQHFLTLLRPLALLQNRDAGLLRIVDAGCGAAHLSLALCLFANKLGFSTELLGIDRNERLVGEVARAAAELRYDQARFLTRDIAELAPQELGKVDLLVSLHLCDTATDDALIAGARAGARAIVVAPCCQHEVAAQLKQATLDPADAVLASHGSLRDRLGALLTDRLRGLALEAAGYAVDFIEFTDPENTAKNLMIRAEQTPSAADPARRARALESFQALCTRWGLQPSCASLAVDARQ